MKYPEENLAKDLYYELSQHFADRTPLIEYKIQGCGVHWLCTVKQNDNFCSIDCFHERDGIEYCISFERNAEKIAEGRTSAKFEAIHAVDDWVQGSELSILYDKFLFVDRNKRDIFDVRDDLVANFPELSPLAEIEEKSSHFCQLWFKWDDRLAHITFGDINKETLNIDFYWDKSSILFNTKNCDRKLLAKILKRWVYDRALPSVIRTEFPSVEISKLADFYEQGNPIEGEFLESWDSIEKFYESMSGFYGELLNPMIELVKSIRKENYDRQLRAGQSMLFLCLSRSQSHGALGVNYLVFAGENNSYEINGEEKISQSLQVTYYANGAIAEKLVENEIALTNPIRKLLQKLSEQLIYICSM